MVDRDEVIARRVTPFVPNVPLVDFDCQLFNVVDTKVSERLLSLALSQLGQACDADEEGSLANPLLMCL